MSNILVTRSSMPSLDEYVDESLGKDAIYISFGGKRERVCIPLVDDDEIKRIVGYLKNN